MIRLVTKVKRPWRCAASGVGAKGRNMSERGKIKLQVSIWPLLLLLAITVLMTTCSQVTRGVNARYVHPTYKFRSVLDGIDEDMDQLERQAAASGPARRQEFENSDGDGDDDESDDQNTAASYQNQDDGNSGRGGGGGGDGGATDGYDDTEPDGPYEETPVEQEGQADLERFFDDHLGASDRDGMDKENLPSNLVELLSEPPMTSAQQQAQATSNSITVMPMASVVNQQVHPIRSSALESGGAPRDPFGMMSTTLQQETSFIRLPDEKLIVTHQVTSARNRPMAPLKLPASSAHMSPDVDDNADNEDEHHRTRARSNYNHKRPILSGLIAHGRGNRPAQTADHGTVNKNILSSPRGIALSQLTASRNDGDALAARGSEIVATEDEDDDRVYVTNATDKPFRIADLDGYDPEEDFADAAKELEVMATASERQRRRPASRTAAAHNKRAHSARALANRARLAASTRAAPLGDDDQYAWAASGAAQEVVSFRVPEVDQLHGEPSETDEVTFGQDDPYQTDLEAEMRQQEFDKISNWRAEPAARRAAAEPTNEQLDDSQPDQSDGSNTVVDKGQQSRPSEDKDDDADVELDNEYQSEPRVEQTEARSMRATSRPVAMAGTKRRKDDFDDEGSWANDGVDEVDIPSQAQQNIVLEKAAKRDEAARRAAVAEEAQQPDDQSGQAADGESERMPNADYLKNDLKDDDLGYAKAA